MNFGTLKADILALIGRAPADACYRLVTADINNSLRLRAMEKTATLTEAASVAMPADFLALISIYRDANPRTTLRPTTPQALHGAYEATGTPWQYAIVDGALLLSPGANTGASINLRYYGKVADLVADADTNAILAAHPGIYIYGTLKHHAALLRDPEAGAMWAAEYAGALAVARAAEQSDRYSGAPMTPYVGPVA